MGQVRKLWREHLDIDDDELRVFARAFAVATAHESLDELRGSLDLAFRVAGLRRVPLSESAFVYDDIPFQWLAQGKSEFNRHTFKEACEAEGLLDTGSSRPRVFGIKSFEHPIDKLEHMRELATGRARTLIEGPTAAPSDTTRKRRNVYDARHQHRLPGKLAMSEHKPRSADVEVTRPTTGAARPATSSRSSSAAGPSTAKVCVSIRR